MKQAEKQRLTDCAREAINDIVCDHREIKSRAQKVGLRFSPTNADKFRELSEIVWWLIAVESYQDAMRLLDALCEIEDEYYWMFHAMASTFATRAWLNSRLKKTSEARHDAKKALAWILRDPNPKPITKLEIDKSLNRFDDWLERADNETGTVTAIQVLSHALRVLVMYQQFGKAGDPATKNVPVREFTIRLNSAIERLKSKLLAWK
jgi:hypothetical protein